MSQRLSLKAFCFNLAALLCMSLLFNSLSSVSYAEDTAARTAEGSELFTARDLNQTPELKGAKEVTVLSGKDVTLTEEGVYVLRGSASDSTVLVDAGKDATLQLVLDGLHITNREHPAIYIRSAAKVFVTIAADSVLSTTGKFLKDGGSKVDAVIFSRADLVLNGTAALTVDSTSNGIACKNVLKVTGGEYNITAASKAFEVKDSIFIFDGTFNLKAGTDGLHAEDKDDDTKGTIRILSGDFVMNVEDDAIHADAAVTIDGGSFIISAAEGIESTYVLINGGSLSMEAWGDGINAGRKSPVSRPTIEITGGEIIIVMSDGDTDGIDSNGDLIITGGHIDITGSSAFDTDGNITFTGGTVVVNGQPVDSIPGQTAAAAK